MGIDPQIPLDAKAPNPMASLSSLLGVAQGALNYRKSQALFDPNVQQAQGQAESAAAKGQVDQANVQPLIQQQAAQTSTAQTGAKSAQFTLQKAYMGTALQTADGLINDPRIAADPAHYDPQAATNAILEAKNQMIAKGVPADQAELTTAPLIMKIHQPGAVQQALKNALTGNLAPQGQAGAITPNGPMVTNNIQSGQINTNPLAGNVGSAVPGTTQTQLVPLGQQQSVTTDVAGNKAIQTKGAYGDITGLTPLPGTSSAAGPAPITTLPPGDAAAIPVLTHMRLATNQAAAQVPEQRANNQNLLQLLTSYSGAAPTGNGAALLAKIQSTVGLGPWASYATTYNRIAHLTALQTQNNESAMGVHTDAGAKTSEIAAGSPSQNPAALIESIKLNDATAAGLSLYNRGMEQAAQGPTGNLAVRKFQNEWSQYYTPTVMRLQNAVQTGDSKEIGEVLDQVAGPNYKGDPRKSPGVADLLRRAHAIQNMSELGHP
jgi:hypothetical protein